MYQPPAKWGLSQPEGARAMNTTSSVVPRWFRGQNETIRIAGPGEKPSVPLSQRSEQEQSALIAAKTSALSTMAIVASTGASGSGPQALSHSQSQPLVLQPVDGEESDWDRDMRLIRENEYWEGRIVDIPTPDLQDRYRLKFTDVGVYQKIGIFKMLEYFEWSHERALQLVQILEKTPSHLVINMVDILQELEKTPRYLDIGVDFFGVLEEDRFMDLLGG